MKISLDSLSKLAVQAGKEILRIYYDNSLSRDINYKSDNSPLTLADKASNNIIVHTLRKLDPKIPILSEEEKNIEYLKRKNWNTFWLVDPLDGTKEFIKRNGEFTVNIALIQDRFPVFGIVYAPILKKLYIGDQHNNKALLIQQGGDETVLKVNRKEKNRIAVGSRSHASEEEAQLLKSYGVTKTIAVGSSLKFCMVAEGKADIYYRHGPTMEWDTAAGQAVVEAAGGTVNDYKNNKRFQYNKEKLLNNSFIVKGF
ncbi:MAG: 3'(2'),5'-bisphosphate nucleotidase CysQ [Cytophagales bacterium]|nr:3'(2'),5'-bisphosphate nucleotidase CysQ [Cytophagales bacterium]